ncbi:S ribonuclease [Pyrus ussuriensis x Pyrus communis]|uniref:S ribonuclease n=1 Tax=Pyrus ussuriensis x Pyrus communis TaxID=2448454 RepID=A0A5N5F8D1_9ROSA|nr:S ribonuclease [Pyrus ussuriensis x Pyrus communis]
MTLRSRRNTTRSGHASDASEAENQKHMDEYDMLDIIAAIHALGEAQKEIAASVKELKNSILKLLRKSQLLLLARVLRKHHYLSLKKTS